MALGSNQMTTTTEAVFIPEVWSNEVLRATESALVMAPLVKRYDSLVQSKGDTVHIPNLSNLTASSKSANAQVTLQAPTETETTISINNHYESSFLVEDIAKIQSNYDLLSEYTSKAGYSIAQQVDSDLLGVYTSYTNTDVGTYGTDVTDSVLVNAIEALNVADAPIDNRAFIVRPEQISALLLIDKFVRADAVGDARQRITGGPNNRYMFGELYGTPVYYSTNVPTTSGTPTQQHNQLLHKEAVALAMQLKPRTQASYIQEYLGNLVTVDTIYGYSVLRTDFGIEIRS